MTSPGRPDTSLRPTVLYDAAAIADRVRSMGAAITETYRGRDMVLIGVLKGSFLFLADLVRQIDLPLEIDFLGVTSYGDQTETTGVVRITSDLARPIEGKHVIVVEDIVDTGLTMQFLLANLATRGPESVRVCTLLHKRERARVHVPLDYIGFEIEDQFVVGYGLDFAEKYRNLPYIGVVPAS
jgi:hypoxanthine phosphoribosyltransferase